MLAAIAMDRTRHADEVMIGVVEIASWLQLGECHRANDAAAGRRLQRT